MKKNTLLLLALICCLCSQSCLRKEAEKKAVTPRAVWTKEQAHDWYGKQGFLIGPNFTPSTAINQLEMWQAETFDTATINRELGWAEDIGMNTARVYLHDLPYQQDSAGFLKRIDTFLAIAKRHNISTLR